MKPATPQPKIVTVKTVPNRADIAEKVRINQPLTKDEVMLWCGWKVNTFRKNCSTYRGGDFLNYHKGRVMPAELIRYLSGAKKI